MDIQIDPHTLERAVERGTNEEEIREVITSGVPIRTKLRTHGKSKDLCFLADLA